MIYYDYVIRNTKHTHTKKYECVFVRECNFSSFETKTKFEKKKENRRKWEKEKSSFEIKLFSTYFIKRLSLLLLILFVVALWFHSSFTFNFNYEFEINKLNIYLKMKRICSRSRIWRFEIKRKKRREKDVSLIRIFQK